jgi:AbrB family looped-hinge helix DNA binding protein
MPPIAIINPQWQVTIPPEIREYLRLTPGEQLQFFINSEGTLTLLPMTKDVRILKGIVPPRESPVSLEEMNV